MITSFARALISIQNAEINSPLKVEYRNALLMDKQYSSKKVTTLNDIVFMKYDIFGKFTNISVRFW